jgi:hypothetical protein
MHEVPREVLATKFKGTIYLKNRMTRVERAERDNRDRRFENRHGYNRPFGRPGKFADVMTESKKTQTFVSIVSSGQQMQLRS